MTEKKEYDVMPCDFIIGFIIAAFITAFCMDQIGDHDPYKTGWWVFFIIMNICYIGYGIKKGWADGDLANGLVIVTGPIAFYTWTVVAVWREYGRKTDGHKKDQT